MYLNLQIGHNNLDDFLNFWSEKYEDSDEKYDRNINKPLTEKSRKELFEWKNGSKISKKKTESIEKNYPLIFDGNYEERYLNYNEPGGAIWNIFYIHCLKPKKWPIFDQHTFRAMRYLKNKEISELGEKSDREKYEIYVNEYIPFIESLNQTDYRKVDKALFKFGQFLKIIAKYYN